MDPAAFHPADLPRRVTPPAGVRLNSLTTRLTLAFLAVSLVPMVILGLASSMLIERTLGRLVIAQLEALADVQQRRLVQLAEHHAEELALVASRLQLRVELDRLLRGDPAARRFIDRSLAEARSSVHDFRTLILLDERGRVIASTEPGEVGRDRSDDPGFRAGRDGYAINALSSNGRGELQFHLAAPLVLEGRRLGILLMETGPEELMGVLRDPTWQGESGETLLARKGPDGTPELLTPPRFAVEGGHPIHLPMQRALESIDGVYEDLADYRGKRVLAVGRFVPPLEWALVVKMDRDEAYAAVRHLRMLVAGAVLGCVLLVAVLAYAVSIFITRPLRGLAAAADDIAAGDLSRRVEVVTTDDVGVLARAFNRMADSVQDANATLEARVAQRTEALEQARARLEQFASVASHDLNEPLRTVKGFADLLSESSDGRLDAESASFIGYIRQGVSDMAVLVDDLLTLARLGQESLDAVPTSAEEAFESALGSLGKAVRDSGGEVTHDPLPDVMADPRHLRRVLLNLMGNALKFRGEGAPRVHVSARREGGAWVLSVRDNGIGIEARDLARIFEPLQRLHSRACYPGTGLGLAICRQIVTLLGGRIWVDSTPGEGSTFSFTLPAVTDRT